jgi:hypothetical protein
MLLLCALLRTVVLAVVVLVVVVQLRWQGNSGTSERTVCFVINVVILSLSLSLKVAIFMGESDSSAPSHLQQSMLLVPMDAILQGFHTLSHHAGLAAASLTGGHLHGQERPANNFSGLCLRIDQRVCIATGETGTVTYCASGSRIDKEAMH